MEDSIKKELDGYINDKKLNEVRTELSKAKFIKEIKGGLGEEIKRKITPKPKEKGFFNFIKKIFNKF